VASDRQQNANRRNAQKSTGPRSAGGKARASKNAYRHGFAARKGPDEIFAKQVGRLARRLSRDSDSIMTLSYAMAAAEAEITIARLRQTKVEVIEKITNAFYTGTPETIRQMVPQLTVLDQYEKQTRSRRNRALRQLIIDRIVQSKQS